ncbi:ExbD/TolR family protein, partial [Klebsiella pneumoniae]
IPFIDVLLVIVIFLMVTTTYSKFTALQVTLPTADAQKALEQPFEINIAIDANGRYAINNKRIAARDAQGLSEEMQAAV